MSDKTGERSIADPFIASGQVFFVTLVPGDTRCGGGTRSYVLNGLTGLENGKGINGLLSQAGAMSSVLILETRREMRPDDAGEEAIRSAIKRKIFMVDPASGVLSPKLLREWPADRDTVSRRIGWRELPNWRELLQPSPGK